VAAAQNSLGHHITAGRTIASEREADRSYGKLKVISVTVVHLQTRGPTEAL
jgi:hypothetical protein